MREGQARARKSPLILERFFCQLASQPPPLAPAQERVLPATHPVLPFFLGDGGRQDDRGEREIDGLLTPLLLRRFFIRGRKKQRQSPASLPASLPAQMHGMAPICRLR